MSYGIKLHISGDFASFTRPDERGPVFLPMERWLKNLSERDNNPPP